MTDDIYEVTQEEYLDFIKTLKPQCFTENQKQIDDWHYEITEISNLTNKLICKKIVTLDLAKKYVTDQRYYIIELPEAEESQEPTGTLHIELKTPEELKTFFKIISECSKKHD